MNSKSLYLALYNAASAAVWAVILVSTLVDVATGFYLGSPHYVGYPHKLLVWVQATNALFETAHAVLGLVPLPISSLLLQFFARLVIVAILYFVPTSPGNFSKAYAVLSVAWASTEIVRYSFYLGKQVDVMPYGLKWARYSAFIVLYPMGLLSEPLVVYKTLDSVLGFAYWFLAFGLLLYVPGFLRLYSYMWKQRKRYLG